MPRNREEHPAPIPRVEIVPTFQTSAISWGWFVALSVAAIGILLILAALYDALVPVTWGSL